ncbi:tripartite tricarboxylate transporter substrate binding protein [Verticiella sediminum]|uniref:Tripartite tricarboxylate transporter substrate binding protein n=1 Tax=Verticiella sediminum TaxID=1247510 RepID=A0A556AWM2_9BURK|nr:tripartite tricarboxylate transporter substrate binding protein [Verticiella sediminum]TSH97327.1 tripartite tricarboxylate transporter substrate binding protein [Verticiella sediminum]
MRVASLVAGFGLAACASSATAAAAAVPDAGFPVRPVTMIVSYAPGNVTDTLARVMAEGLARKWRQPVTVENRPGMGGSLGAQAAARAPADGYTLLFSAMAAMAINPHVYANVGYDARADFAPIAAVAYPKGVLAVSPALPVNTVAELVAYSKAHPGALNYASLGNGTVPHLNFELLKAATGLQAEHIPYKASSAAMTDMLGGRVQLLQESLAVILPTLQDGKAKALYSSTNERLPELPDVPTAAESVPGFSPLRPWLGLFVPAGVPQDIRAKLESDILAVAAEPAVAERVRTAGMVPLGYGQERFRQELDTDYARLGDLVQRLKIGVD